MNNNYYAPITNQQNVENGAIGVQIAKTSEAPSITELKEVFKEVLKNIHEEKQPEMDSVMEELSAAVGAGRVCQKDEEHWTGRFLAVLSAGANVATITSSPWWPTLTDKLHQFFSSLPF